MALAWLLAKGPDMVPIPGTKRRTCLEENAAAIEVQLTAEDLGALERAVPGRRRPLFAGRDDRSLSAMTYSRQPAKIPSCLPR